MRKKIVARNLALTAGFFAAAALGYGRGIDTVVEVPTTRDSALVEVPTAATPQPIDDSTSNLSLGRESKNVVDEKAVVEQEKTPSWIWSTDIGYDSEYIFRGTNLTPGSKGIGYFDASVTKLGVFQSNDSLTFGVTGIHQFGRATVDSWSLGESGGNTTGSIAGAPVSGGGTVTYLRLPQTVQTRFNEVDLFLSYRFSVGPIDVTIGDIGFIIDRDATTFETDVLPVGFRWLIPPTGNRIRVVGPDPTVEDEQFDRAYIRLSTTKLCKFITPQITYYQTLLSEGSQPTGKGLTQFYPPDVNGRIPQNPRPFDERNPEDYGGYLEGKIVGRFPVTHWMDIDPYGLVSVSFRDRTEPGGANPFAGHPLTGWNHAQAGVKIPIRVMHF